jgi:glycosyltransferase involved in cell wall biosynthesis
VATPFLRSTVIQRSAVPRKCSTILNLPDPRYFKFKNHSADRAITSKASCGFRDSSRFRIIYPGSLSFLHGVDIAIKAMQWVKPEPSLTCELHIYGYGSDTQINQLKELVDQLNLHNRVFFHPTVFAKELVEIIHTMDAGLVPKRDGVFIGEALSSKLFEFAALGIPTIVSRTVGDNFFFDDSMVLFFEPENEKDLAGCIIQLARDRSLRQRLVHNAGSVPNKINWNLMKRELYDIYAGLLHNRPVAQAIDKNYPLGLPD